jgi:uncharacterized protein
MQTDSRFLTRYGPWAVVTGASSGIGRALAGELAAHGLHLVLVARRSAELEALAAALASRHGIQARALALDLAQPSAQAGLENATRELDVGLLVAASGFGSAGDFLDGDLDNELAMLDVNGRAVLGQTHHFAPRFVRRGRGGLILFGSLVGFQGAPRAAHYAATKAYVQTLAEGLHVELRPRGVDVLSAAPGPVRSGFSDRAGMRLGLADDPATVARATLRALGRRMTVTPGLVSKFLTWSLMTAPRFLRVRILGKIMAGMTAHPPASDRTSA